MAIFEEIRPHTENECVIRRRSRTCELANITTLLTQYYFQI